jgi:hypothetical protein
MIVADRRRATLPDIIPFDQRLDGVVKILLRYRKQTLVHVALPVYREGSTIHDL